MADKRRSPNQRTINHIHKEPCDTNNIYARINKEALFAARRELTDGEFSLWIFFASQSEKLIDYDFGPIIIEKELGIKRAKYTSAIDGLVKKGYLVPVERKGYYDFYEIPIDSGDDKYNYIAPDGEKFSF